MKENVRKTMKTKENMSPNSQWRLDPKGPWQGTHGGTVVVAGTVDGAHPPCPDFGGVVNPCVVFPVSSAVSSVPTLVAKFDKSDGSLQGEQRNVWNVGTTTTLGFDAKPRPLHQERFRAPTLQGADRRSAHCTGCTQRPLPFQPPRLCSAVAQAACGTVSRPVRAGERARLVRATYVRNSTCLPHLSAHTWRTAPTRCAPLGRQGSSWQQVHAAQRSCQQRACSHATSLTTRARTKSSARLTVGFRDSFF